MPVRVSKTLKRTLAFSRGLLGSWLLYDTRYRSHGLKSRSQTCERTNQGSDNELHVKTEGMISCTAHTENAMLHSAGWQKLTYYCNQACSDVSVTYPDPHRPLCR